MRSSLADVRRVVTRALFDGDHLDLNDVVHANTREHAQSQCTNELVGCSQIFLEAVDGQQTLVSAVRVEILTKQRKKASWRKSEEACIEPAPTE